VSGFIADDKQWALATSHRESLLAGKSFTVMLYDELAIRSPRIQSFSEVRQLVEISGAVFIEPLFDVRCWPTSKAGIYGDSDLAWIALQVERSRPVRRTKYLLALPSF
jgi:hypothetical protein